MKHSAFSHSLTLGLQKLALTATTHYQNLSTINTILTTNQHHKQSIMSNQTRQQVCTIYQSCNKVSIAHHKWCGYYFWKKINWNITSKKNCSSQLSKPKTLKQNMHSIQTTYTQILYLLIILILCVKTTNNHWNNTLCKYTANGDSVLSSNC